MEGGDAVDRMAAHAREMRHTDVLVPCFVDQREPPEQLIVAGIPLTHVVQETTIDLVDDFQVPRQRFAEERHGPLLEGLRQKRVVRVAAGLPGNRPGLIPVHRVLVHEETHQLGHRDGRVRVVQLDGPVRAEICQGPLLRQVETDHVLQRARHEEMLLRQPELLAGDRLVIGVEHL